MNIYEKLQKCRVELQEMKLRKGGKNEFAKFEYYELADFMPSVNQLFNKHQLHSVFNIEDMLLGDKVIQVATLKIINTEKPDETECFVSPTAEANLRGCTPIQSLGGVHTYMKRYLYLNALEIVEPDLLDTIVGADTKEVKKEIKVETKKAVPENKTKITTKDEVNVPQEPLIAQEHLAALEKQDEKLKQYILKKFNVNSLSELTMKDAIFIIKSLKTKSEENK